MILTRELMIMRGGAPKAAGAQYGQDRDKCGIYNVHLPLKWLMIPWSCFVYCFRDYKASNIACSNNERGLKTRGKSDEQMVILSLIVTFSFTPFRSK
jgi:hypothetical protein